MPTSACGSSKRSRRSSRRTLGPAYRDLLGMAQMLNRGREGSKANWARASRTYRPPILELGHRLAERGLIDYSR